MAEPIIACRESARRAVRAQVLAAWLAVAGISLAQAASPEPSASTPSAPSVAPTFSVRVVAPRITGRLCAADIGLVVKTAAPYSVAVGEHCVTARGLQAAQVLRLDMPTKAVFDRDEFEALRRAFDAFFGPTAQGLALALGFDAALCSRGCAASRISGYFNSPSSRPLLTTDDAARRVRMALYPAPGLLAALGVELRVEPASVLPDAHRLLLAVTDSERVSLEPTPDWVPGGLGDHLTSFGGDLQGAHGQSTALDWIVSGATANHGAVSEPCNHAQKFPHPQVLLLHYLQGSTATPKPCSGP